MGARSLKKGEEDGERRKTRRERRNAFEGLTAEEEIEQHEEHGSLEDPRVSPWRKVVEGDNED